jgi:tRNA (mo5U34)-methyltransferase
VPSVIGKVPAASAMPTRFWTRRGFKLEITVPDSLARPIRAARSNRTLSWPGRAVDEGRRQSPSRPEPSPLQREAAVPRLRFADTRELRAKKRDPRAALAFISDFADKSSAARGTSDSSPRSLDESESGTSSPARLADTVARLPWYHTIEMPGNVVSRGMFDHRPLVAHYGIPQTLANMRCLDIACSDGFWAFEFERRGGGVTAVDIGSWADWDVPAGAPVPFGATEVTDSAGPARSGADAFEVARAALRSGVQRMQQNLYELEPGDLGTFDFVHSGDVLLHLARPLDGLRVMRRLTAPGGTALIADVIDPELSEPTLTRYFGGFDRHLWWMPGLDCLAQMVYDAGFSEVELVTIYNLAPWDLPEGHWRAVLRARA